MNLSTELAIAENLARRAGMMAKSMQHDLNIRHKPAGEGPVSDADLAVDLFICSELKKHFPKDLFISEESYQGEAFDSNTRRVWFIDPIDGTADYVIGGSDFVIMIGLVVNNKPVLGVIFHPSTNTMWSSDSRNKRLISKKPESIRLVVSPNSRSRKQTQLIQLLAPSQILRASSIGLKAMMVLDKKADFYICWSMRLKMWDTCAPAAILAARGGVMAFIDGRPLNFSGTIAHSNAVMVANFKPDEHILGILKTITES